ncbi:MAG: hypothetical protein ACW99U_18540 [Candidatus Thorarchaeota archaeon]|jgi:hypothetical protein
MFGKKKKSEPTPSEISETNKAMKAELLESGKYTKEELYTDEELSKMTDEDLAELDDFDLEDESPKIIENLDVPGHLTRRLNEFQEDMRSYGWRAILIGRSGNAKKGQKDLGPLEIRFRAEQLIRDIRLSAVGFKEGMRLGLETIIELKQLKASVGARIYDQIVSSLPYSVAFEQDMGPTEIHKSLFKKDPEEVKQEAAERKAAVVIPPEYWLEVEAE